MSVNIQFFSWNCTHILTRTQGEKFEYTFLVKIASKGTSLIVPIRPEEVHFLCSMHAFCLLSLLQLQISSLTFAAPSMSVQDKFY